MKNQITELQVKEIVTLTGGISQFRWSLNLDSITNQSHQPSVISGVLITRVSFIGVTGGGREYDYSEGHRNRHTLFTEKQLVRGGSDFNPLSRDPYCLKIFLHSERLVVGVVSLEQRFVSSLKSRRKSRPSVNNGFVYSVTERWRP